MLGAKAVFHYEDMDLDRKYGRKEKKNMVYAWSNSKTAPLFLSAIFCYVFSS